MIGLLVDLNLPIYNFILFLQPNMQFFTNIYIYNYLSILSKGAKAFKNSAIYIQSLESKHLWKKKKPKV